MDQIQVSLTSRTDRDGNKYFFASPRLNVPITLSEMVFFVFMSEEGQETLVIRARQTPDREKEKRIPEVFKSERIPMREPDEGNGRT